MPDTGLPVYLVDRPDLFRRAGGLYQDGDGRDWSDNHLRFAALGWAGVAVSIEGDGTGWRPEIVHANDWHTGLLPALRAHRPGPRPATVFTIHNIAFQGNFPLDTARVLNVPDALLAPDGAEFYGNLSFLKAAIRYADRLTTVSPNYASEILTPEHGAGLDGVLRSRAGDLVGILNGVDYGVWDPAIDPSLPSRYSPTDMAGKAACRAALHDELGLDCSPDVPLVISLNRLTHQKMADVVVEALPMILAQGAQMVLHGEGDKNVEAAVVAAAHANPTQLSVRIGYEERLAHLIIASGDIALTASRFEPCGLTTMYGLRYGTLPVTRPVGGLADTVVDLASERATTDGATGFVFEGTTAREMSDCVERASASFRDPAAWSQLRYNAMSRDFGWEQSARRYLALYEEIAHPRAGRGMARPGPDERGPLAMPEGTAAVAL
jgi:starch synthase